MLAVIKFVSQSMVTFFVYVAASIALVADFYVGSNPFNSVWTTIAHAASVPFLSMKEASRMPKAEARLVLRDKDRVVELLKAEGGKDVFNLLRRRVSNGLVVFLDKVKLDNADLQGINLTAAKLHWSKIRETDFSGAKLLGAYLFHCHCHHSDFTDADLRPLEGQRTVLGYSFLNGANFTNANLERVDLIQASLVEAIFDGAEIGMVDARSSKWPYASLRGVTSESGPIDMQGSIGAYADLTDASLNSVNLRNSVLANANLTRADLSNANLQSAEMRGVTVDRTNFGHANMHNVILYHTDLRTANMRGVDLTDAGLLGINASGVNFGGARLNLINADFANFSGANLSGVSLHDAALIGADLSSATLEGADLSDANLQGANLADANLRDVDFSGANLIGADFTGADLAGAILEGAKIDDSTLKSRSAETASPLHKGGAMFVLAGAKRRSGKGMRPRHEINQRGHDLEALRTRAFSPNDSLGEAKLILEMSR